MPGTRRSGIDLDVEDGRPALAAVSQERVGSVVVLRAPSARRRGTTVNAAS